MATQIPSSTPTRSLTSNPPNSPPPTQPQQPTQQPSTTQSKTPVTLPPTSHLDPSAYVRGPHKITISSNVLIHPRAHLITLLSPLTIAQGCIISSKALIGGPLPPSSTTSPPPTLPPPPPSSTKPTTLGQEIHIHPNVLISSGAQIGDYTIIEANAVIGHGVVIGAHVKICAGVHVSRDVEAWNVVYGINGEFRRRRRRGMEGGIEEGREADVDLLEDVRLLGVRAERESTMAILRRSAVRSGAARGKR